MVLLLKGGWLSGAPRKNWGRDGESECLMTLKSSRAVCKNRPDRRL
jgi:hypothetical protein